MFFSWLIRELDQSSIIAYSLCFLDSKVRDEYAWDLNEWAESNEPVMRTRLCLIEMYPDVPIPHFATIFYYDEYKEEFEKWLGKWFSFRHSNGKPIGYQDRGYTSGRALLHSIDFGEIIPFSIWLGKQPEIEKPVERNLSSEMKDEKTPLKPDNINWCPICHNNDKIQKVSALFSGGTFSGGVVGPSFESDGGIGVAFGYGQVSTILVQMIIPPQEPSKSLFESRSRFNERWGQWQSRFRVWESLYYCYRDDIVYDPISLDCVPPSQIDILVQNILGK